jgi:cell division GTPase FtsZ
MTLNGVNSSEDPATGIVKQFTIPVLYGVGSGGCRIAASIVSGRGMPGGRRQRLDTFAVCISSSERDTRLVSRYEESIITFTIGDGTGSGMDPKRGREDYLRSPVREKILEVPRVTAEQLNWSNIDMIPVVFTAGFGCGSGAGPELVADLVRRYPESLVLGICTLPFNYEGPETYKRAVEAFKRAAKHAPVIAVSNQYFAELLGKELDFFKLLDHINDRIASILHPLIRSMGSSNVVTAIDTKDLRRILKPAPALLIQWRLESPAEMQNLSQHNSNTLTRISKGLGKMSCVAVVEVGELEGHKFLQSYIDDLQREIEAATGARLKEFKAMVTRRPDAKPTFVTTLIGDVKFYA